MENSNSIFLALNNTDKQQLDAEGNPLNGTRVYTEDFKKEYDIKCQNCKTQWKERYADYKTKTLEGEYLDMMKQIAEG